MDAILDGVCLEEVVKTSTSLEAFLQCHCGIIYQKARDLVMEGRTNLNMSKWSHWTPELCMECLRIYYECGPHAPQNMLKSSPIDETDSATDENSEESTDVSGCSHDEARRDPSPSSSLSSDNDYDNLEKLFAEAQHREKQLEGGLTWTEKAAQSASTQRGEDTCFEVVQTPETEIRIKECEGVQVGERSPNTFTTSRNPHTRKLRARETSRGTDITVPARRAEGSARRHHHPRALGMRRSHQASVSASASAALANVQEKFKEALIQRYTIEALAFTQGSSGQYRSRGEKRDRPVRSNSKSVTINATEGPRPNANEVSVSKTIDEASVCGLSITVDENQSMDNSPYSVVTIDANSDDNASSEGNVSTTDTDDCFSFAADEVDSADIERPQDEDTDSEKESGLFAESTFIGDVDELKAMLTVGATFIGDIDEVAYTEDVEKLSIDQTCRHINETTHSSNSGASDFEQSYGDLGYVVSDYESSSDDGSDEFIWEEEEYYEEEIVDYEPTCLSIIYEEDEEDLEDEEYEEIHGVQRRSRQTEFESFLKSAEKHLAEEELDETDSLSDSSFSYEEELVTVTPISA